MDVMKRRRLMQMEMDRDPSQGQEPLGRDYGYGDAMFNGATGGLAVLAGQPERGMPRTLRAGGRGLQALGALNIGLGAEMAYGASQGNPGGVGEANEMARRRLRGAGYEFQGDRRRALWDE